MEHDPAQTEKKSLKVVAGLSLAALGVVYGDIGTSPLYAIKEIFFGKEPLIRNEVTILGAISTVFWALTLIVTIKYVFLVLRADNFGEGGVFALYGLLRKVKSKYTNAVLIMLILAAGLLFGDGLITPAISVLSAVEGLSIATSSLTPFIIPITIGILVALFGVQKFGTTKIGAVFGPIMMIWFFVIAILGGSQVLSNTEILKAINPYYAYHFFITTPIHELLLVLGFVMLSVTGGEAMYADMGHFGRTPIKLSWLTIAYPALILNYLGQGAYLLKGGDVFEGSIFYSLAPSWSLVPLIILATLATVIASQALITGAFSLASQATALHLMPFLPTKHTHGEHEGQIFISIINIFLYIGCVTLVLVFRSSGNLASAYGLAVSGVMFVTTLSVAMLAVHRWRWPLLKALLIFIPFGIIDGVFVVANSLKLVDGGYVPLVIGLSIMSLMIIWNKGIMSVVNMIDKKPSMTVRDLLAVRHKTKHFSPQTVIMISQHFITNDDDHIPALNELYLKKYGIFPLHLVFVHVHILKQATAEKERYQVVEIDPVISTGTITSININFGFMEEEDIEPVLKNMMRRYPHLLHTDTDKWVFHIFRPQLFLAKSVKSAIKRYTYSVFSFMYRNSMTEDERLGLSSKANVTAEIVPIVIK